MEIKKVFKNYLKILKKTANIILHLKLHTY